MKIWIYFNDIQQGPYTLDELSNLPILPSTPVWYEGLNQWLPASDAPATAHLFAYQSTSDNSSCQQPQYRTEQTASSQQHSYSSSLNQPIVEDAPPCPPTYMGWAIFCLICCCLPCGIIAVIFSVLVTNNYNKGDYQQAQKMSTYAEWTIIISIVLGLVTAPFSWLLYF